MEIRPILSAMWRSRTGSVLVALQIAIALAIVVNCVFLAKSRIEFIGRPSGIDVERIIVASSTGFGESYEHDNTIENDLRLLRGLPGVVSASATQHVPMSQSGSTSSYRISTDEDAPSIHANLFGLDEQALETLGVKLASGRNFATTEIRRSDHENAQRFTPQVIITQALADRLFTSESALGQRLFDHLGESAEVIGIVQQMHGSFVHWNELNQVMWLPQRPDGPEVKYMIRTQPGQRDRLVPVVEKTLADANRSRLVRKVRPMSDMVADSYGGDRAIAVILLVAVVLLLTVTGLGIVGLASFTVRQRTKQIGTRRAVGARKWDIIRYFLMENWLMTTLGIVVGIALTIGLNYLLSTMFDIDRLDYFYLPMGMVVIWLLGLFAVAGPSRRASQVSPAIATRTV